MENHRIQVTTGPRYKRSRGQEDLRHQQHPSQLSLQQQRKRKYHLGVLPSYRPAQRKQQNLQGLPERLRVHRNWNDLQRRLQSDPRHQKGNELHHEQGISRKVILLQQEQVFK